MEATKFTEVGFHGRDVDQIIRDLVDNAVTLMKQKQRAALQVWALLLGDVLTACNRGAFDPNGHAPGRRAQVGWAVERTCHAAGTMGGPAGMNVWRQLSFVLLVLLPTARASLR